MHARELVQLAAVVATNGEVLIRSARRISSSSLEAYWTASKCRLDRWGRAIKAIKNSELNQTSSARPIRRRTIQPLLEEILTSEVLTRVWTGVVSELDHRNQTQEGEPVVRSVLIGHLEARHKTLQLLASNKSISARQAVALNRLRRRVECWTDMLLGLLMPITDLAQLAFKPSRAWDFAASLRHETGKNDVLRSGRPLILSSLRAAFLSGMSEHSLNGDLNERIASSVLASFGPDLFDATGQFQSLWQLRLTHTASDVQGMIDRLLSDDLDAPILDG